MIKINENSVHVAEQAISNFKKEIIEKYGFEKGGGIIVLAEEMGMLDLMGSIPIESLAQMHDFIVTEITENNKEWTVTLSDSKYNTL